MKDFEEAFSDFLDRKEYDHAESALFSMIRIAFKAGWLAADGRAPKAQKVVELLKPSRAVPPESDPDSIETDIASDNE